MTNKGLSIMKRKIYNIILILLIISAIIIGLLIFNKYYKEAKNEEQLSDFISELEKRMKRIKKNINIMDIV